MYTGGKEKSNDEGKDEDGERARECMYWNKFSKHF